MSTAYVTFDNVRVPAENTLGPEGGGIFVILNNFNHGFWVMVCTSAQRPATDRRGMPEMGLATHRDRQATQLPAHRPRGTGCDGHTRRSLTSLA